MRYSPSCHFGWVLSSQVKEMLVWPAPRVQLNSDQISVRCKADICDGITRRNSLFGVERSRDFSKMIGVDTFLGCCRPFEAIEIFSQENRDVVWKNSLTLKFECQTRDLYINLFCSNMNRINNLKSKNFYNWDFFSANVVCRRFKRNPEVHFHLFLMMRTHTVNKKEFETQISPFK